MQYLSIYWASTSIEPNVDGFLVDEISKENSQLGLKASLQLQLLLRFLWCDFRLLMDVKEWMSYKCSDEGTCTQEEVISLASE